MYRRLVKDVRRAQLDCHRIADLLRGEGGFDGIGDDPGRQGGKPSGLQNGVCQMGVEGELFAFQRLSNQLLAQLEIEPVTLQGGGVSISCFWLRRYSTMCMKAATALSGCGRWGSLPR